MTQDDGFKFVSVEDDDEFVIQAGAVPAGAVAEDLPESGEAVYESEEDEAPVAADDVEDPEEAAERAKFEKAKARRAAERDANRMITTEEDLKASVPFAGMQRAIIIVAVILIVVFVVYYNFGM